VIRLLLVALSGLLFGLGLTISGMVNPAKVLGFLDIAGHWDPSLAFVMGGAIPVAAIGFRITRRLDTPLCAPRFQSPEQARPDARLCLGAILFGIGWGLAGYCPGPALASLSFGGANAWLFVAAMLAGMAVFALGEWARTSRP
jgi:uncharacterized membrane protein YedE/YeeE